MEGQTSGIDTRYQKYYAERNPVKVYPTEFVVRTFLGRYPGLAFSRSASGNKILDVGFGDGRNTAFLCDLGLEVSGIEIAQGIVDQASARLSRLGHTADLRVGRNSCVPFDDDYFDYILSCHCCYYCDEGETLNNNLQEYARVLKNGGYLIASIADRTSYIFKNAEELSDGSMRIQNDPYGTRNGYRLYGFFEVSEIRNYFSRFFRNFSFGHAYNDFYGIAERVFWVVCEKKEGEQ